MRGVCLVLGIAGRTGDLLISAAIPISLISIYFLLVLIKSFIVQELLETHTYI